MFMGLPWITTLTAAATAYKKVSAEGAKAPSAEPAGGRLAERLRATEDELRELRARSGTPVDRPRLRMALVTRDRETMPLRAAVTAAEERVDALDRQATAAQGSVSELKRTLRQMRDELAAGMVFRRLRPVCCPSCDNGIDAKRYETAEGVGTCALCGERHVEEEEDGLRIDDLQADVREAEQVVARLNAELASAQKRLREAEAARDDNQARIGRIAAELALAEDPEMEFRVRALEAQAEQLREIIAEAAAPVRTVVSDDAAVLRQVEKVTRDLFDDLQRDVLQEVSEEVATLSRRFGVQHVESMSWSGNNILDIRQAAADITFSKLSPGENLRVRIAAALAVVAVARRRRFGRYPGLLVLDSPRSQEMTDDDFAALMASVQEVITETGDTQVIVGAATKPTLLGVVPGQQTLHAEGSQFLF
jgi:DNA repair exonuclease SbcCD ATPase subunit